MSGAAERAGRTRRVAYLVSRFPATSETFVVRELGAVSEQPGIELELMALFAPREQRPHRSAERWVERLQRPGAGASARALLAWGAQRPLTLARCLGAIVTDQIRRPRMLVRSLATLPIACAHASSTQRQGVDHVHAHFANYPALAAWVIARLTGVSYSFTAHAHDIFVDQSALPRRIGDAAFVATISEFNARFLAELNQGSTPIEVVHMGIEPERYRFRPRAAPQEGPVRALCVASLQEKKGHRVLFEALAGAPELERIELDLVGDGELRNELEGRARALGIGARVRFHGRQDEEQVRELLDRADLFVLPSLIAADGQMEGIPVALIEAIACGLYAVASRMSGIPELIRDPRIGDLAAPGDPAALRASLAAALAAEPPPASGRELIESEFDVARSARRMAELLA